MPNMDYSFQNLEDTTHGGDTTNPDYSNTVAAEVPAIETSEASELEHTSTPRGDCCRGKSPNRILSYSTQRQGDFPLGVS